MKALILAIEAQLKTVPGVKFVLVWNDQVNQLEYQTQYSFTMPAIFVEFVNPHEIKQLGDGLQLYDPLIVRLHILDHELDAGSEGMERNLAVMDFAQEVFKVMQGFEPDGAAQFVRIAEERDYQHKGVYHLIQDYNTNYLDCSKQKSTDGVEIAGGVVDPNITVIYNPIKPYLKQKP